MSHKKFQSLLFKKKLSTHTLNLSPKTHNPAQQVQIGRKKGVSGRASITRPDLKPFPAARTIVFAWALPFQAFIFVRQSFFRSDAIIIRVARVGEEAFIGEC